MGGRVEGGIGGRGVAGEPVAALWRAAENNMDRGRDCEGILPGGLFGGIRSVYHRRGYGGGDRGKLQVPKHWRAANKFQSTGVQPTSKLQYGKDCGSADKHSEFKSWRGVAEC